MIPTNSLNINSSLLIGTEKVTAHTMSTEQAYTVGKLQDIKKKSRLESKGEGSRVEIITNEPYTDGPCNTSGQHTFKLYHVEQHIPGWFRVLLPDSACTVEEEAWNAYPYTCTRYRCPFIKHFTLEIETVYRPDCGSENNVFNLSPAELSARTVDFVDIVKDPISGSDYNPDEDPKLYRSEKTGRGPLSTNWHQEFSKGSSQGQPMMCSYKLCRVNFPYWGFQGKIERFIHDIGLRKTILRAHRQAWCWQDEYHGLTMSDIRKLERETQLALQSQNPATSLDTEDKEEEPNDSIVPQQICRVTAANHCDVDSVVKNSGNDDTDLVQCDGKGGATTSKINHQMEQTASADQSTQSEVNKSSHSSSHETCESVSGTTRPSVTSAPRGMSISTMSTGRRGSKFQRMSAIAADIGSVIELLQAAEGPTDDDDDEFFDCCDELPGDRVATFSAGNLSAASSISSLIDRNSSEKETSAESGSNPVGSPKPCPTDILIMVLHGGTSVDYGLADSQIMKTEDLSTFQSTFISVLKSTYPSVLGKIAYRLVPCPNVNTAVMNLLASLNPDGGTLAPESTSSTSVPDIDCLIHESLLSGTLPLLSSSSPGYENVLEEVTLKINSIYREFLKTDEGRGFIGQVYFIGDSMGSLIGFDILCNRHAQKSITNQLDHLSLDEESELAVYDSRGFLSSQNGSTVQRASSYKSVSDSAYHLAPINTDDKASPKERASSFKIPKSTTPSTGSLVTKSRPSAEGTSKLNSGNAAELKITPNRGILLSNDTNHLNHAESNGSEFQASGSVKIRDNKRTCTMRISLDSPSTTDVEARWRTCLEFGVSELFMLGSPIGLVLAHRKLAKQQCDPDGSLTRPACRQIYNMFYASSPTALRIEPLLYDAFTNISPVLVTKYRSKSSNNGTLLNSLADTLMNNEEILCGDKSSHSRDVTDVKVLNAQESNCTNTEAEFEATSLVVRECWWGEKRLDYSLHCPVPLEDLPASSLFHVLHAGFWESHDTAAFILSQIINQDAVSYRGSVASEAHRLSNPLAQLVLEAPTENWIKKRTSLKVKNLSSNHRANDVVVSLTQAQVLVARFMYGPLDMVSLSGEKVDVYAVNERVSTGSELLGTGLTDGAGRLVFEIPNDKRRTEGIHLMFMIVRGDHTCVEFRLAVLPAGTECVVFSIDGSFAASMSLTGTDPKVRPGAVDVVRHWRELDHLVLYVSARPDVQQRKVLDWLAQHRFPRGMVAFADRLTTDSLRQKAIYLKQLVTEAKIRVQAAYGSAKDLAVYQYVDLPPEKTFIVGKLPRKHRGLATELLDGYPAHLHDLVSHPLSRQAVVSLRLAPRRLGCFDMSLKDARKKTPVQKTSSLPSDGLKSSNSFKRSKDKKDNKEVVSSRECNTNENNCSADEIRNNSVTANCCEVIKGANKDIAVSKNNGPNESTKR